MTELDWATTRSTTIDRFQGQTPRPQDEAPIIDIFEQHPQLVLRAIDETASALNAGKVLWAWSVLRVRLERGTTAIREATADTSGEKAKRVKNAKTWIDNAGIYYDQRHDVEAELFGDNHTRGRLGDYTNDTELRAQLLDYWNQQRYRGEQAEADAEAWMRTCSPRQDMSRAEFKARRHPHPDADIDFTSAETSDSTT